MNYEKAYKQALERAKKEWSNNLDNAYKNYRERLEIIFPELAETEDERIKKCIIDTLKGYHHLISTGGVTKEQMIAWLEKQKPVEWGDDDEQYLLVCKNALRKYQVSNKWDADIISKWLEGKLKQGEQKPQKALTWKHWENGIMGNGEGNDEFLIKWGPWHYSVSSCLGSECDYIELSELDKLLRKPNFRERYKRIAESEQFKRTHEGMSVGEDGEMKIPEESLGITSEEYNDVVDECVFGKSKKSGKVETKEVTGTLKEMLDNIDPVELEETRKEMMESMPTDEEVQKLHDHLEMHKQLPKSEPQAVTFIDSGTMQVIEKLNEIIGKLGDLYEVLSKPYVFPYRVYTPPSPVPGMEVWYKTHGVEKVPPVTCETLSTMLNVPHVSGTKGRKSPFNSEEEGNESK